MAIGKMLNRIFDAANIVILLTFTFVCMYPFYYIFIYSISDPRMAQRGITLMPRGITLTNYSDILQLPNLFNATIVSSMRTILGTAITVFCCSFFAYIVTKNELYFRKLIYRSLVVTMYINAGLIPWYLTMKNYGLNNNFLLYVIPTAISAYYVILLRTFIEQLPQSLEESAKIDGAGYIRIFFQLILPLSKPIVATIAVFAAVAQWNTWFDNYFLVQDVKLKTLQLILYEYLNQANAIAQAINRTGSTQGMENYIKMTPASIKMTTTMVVTLPILFVYPFMQKYFVKGIMLGAIKG